MCRDNNLPVRVYDMNIPNALSDIVKGKNIGTLIS
jgi:uridylate kinase